MYLCCSTGNATACPWQWQACGTGYNGTFHDINGRPLVNTKTFPDLKAMATYAHNLGLKAGFYMNNCDCKESGITDSAWVDRVYQESISALVDWGFDGLKLDGCR